MSLRQKNSGQAMIEYLLLVVFLLLLSLKMVGGFTDFMRDSIGNLGHVLSVNLTTGICEKECFFNGYFNGYKN
jgi:hypothetical protein